MAQADPELALRLAKATADLYGDAVQRLLAIVAARLARGIEVEGWAERKLLEVSGLRTEVLAEIRTLEREGGRAVSDAVAGGWKAGEIVGGQDLAEVGIRTTFTRTNRRAVRALIAEAVDQVRSTHVRILRSTVDAYRAAIAEAAGQTVAGVDTRRRAAQRALDRFANTGVTGFVDSANRAWDLASYAEMATRTATGRAQVAGALDRFEAAGRDLVIVSDSPQECRVCRPWEGRILSVSGKDRRYPSVRQATSAGLLHANCRHNLGLYVPGLTRPMRATADPKGDVARQEQRRLERGIRQWQRRAAVALSPEAEQLAKRKADEWRRRLVEHVAANDLKRQRQRETLGGAR